MSALLLSVLVVILVPARADVHQVSARSETAVQSPTRTIEFTTEEGTWMNVDVSPDGQTILFDLLGDIYTVSSAGGEARQLIEGPSWDQMPTFSPDGRWIAFSSDRDGMFAIWTADTSGGRLRRITNDSTAPFRVPVWTPDGTRVVAIRGVSGSGRRSMVAIDARTGAITTIEIDGMPSGPVVAADGRSIYYAADAGFATEIARLDLDSGTSERLTQSRGRMETGGSRPRVSPDGRSLAYARREGGVTELILRDLATGEERELVSPITEDAIEGYAPQDVLPAYAFTPDGAAIIMAIDGRLWRVSIPDGTRQRIPFRAHVRHEVVEAVRPAARDPAAPRRAKAIRWPTMTRDRSTVMFAAVDRIWRVPRDGGTPTPLTSADERAFYPVVSPDGRSIAFTTWSDSALGHVWTMRVDGSERQRLSHLPGRYTRPAWSADGRLLAFVRGSGSERLAARDTFDVVWLEVGHPEQHTVARVPFRPFKYTLFTVPTFSADGSHILFTEPAGTPGIDALVSVARDGSDRNVLAKFFWLRDALPSPDGRFLVFEHQGHIVVVPTPEPSDPGADSLDFDAAGHQLTDIGGNDPQWFDESTLIWSFANTIHIRNVNDPSDADSITIDLPIRGSLASGRLAFTNARVITMRDDEVIDNGSILIEDGRIRAVGAAERVAIPAGTEIIDAGGRTIVPGLIDTHYHMSPDPERELHAEHVWQLRAQLAFGATTLFIPSSPATLHTLTLAELQHAGMLVAPRLVLTGEPILDHPNGYTPPIDSPQTAERIVQRYAAYGIPVIKEYGIERRDHRRWLIDAAARRGLAVVSHGNGIPGMLTRITDGVYAVEHDFPVRIYNDVVQFVARSGAFYTPTLSVSSDLRPTATQWFQSTTDYLADPKLRRLLPPGQLEPRRSDRIVPDHEWHYRTIAEGARRILAAGGSVTIGAHGEAQGIGTLWELLALAGNELMPHEALRAATVVGARKLGIDQHVGTIEPGRVADLLIVNGDPLTDLEALFDVWIVLTGGHVSAVPSTEFRN
ncbi:MAG: amidohydrolase family protein [Longimicrobiales bacterium]